jgi:5-methylcytosine-specific restriction endonuclease McrA
MNKFLVRLANMIIRKDAVDVLPECLGVYQYQPSVNTCYRCGNKGTLDDGFHSYDNYILCNDCATPFLQREIIKLRSAKSRSRKYRTHYDIELLDWMETLVHFGGRCAYCGAGNGTTLDHYIPLERGGETVIVNLLPACPKCNSRKGSLYPSQIKFISDERLEELADYLRSRAR